jgi:hypothetical protein
VKNQRIRLFTFLFVVGLAAAGFVCAQSSTTTYTTDINGNRVASALSSSSDDTQAELSDSINGNQVPLQKVEVRVLRKDARGSETETIIQKYDQTGHLISTDRVVTQKQNLPNGGSTERSTTYRTDVNGTEQEAQRSLTETTVVGSTTTQQTVVERPGINGSFSTAEKSTSVTTGTDTSKKTTETVYRPDQNGDFKEALKQVKEETKSGNQTVVNTANYELGVTGNLQLYDQRVATTVQHPDGSESTQVDLYSQEVPGTVRDPGDKQRVKEQQLITRKKGADGSVTVTTSVRRPSLADPTKLGDPQQISQTVCKGKCDQGQQ